VAPICHAACTNPYWTLARRSVAPFDGLQSRSLEKVEEPFALDAFSKHLWIWLLALSFVIVMITGRLLSNRAIARQRDSILAAGTMPNRGIVPTWVSSVGLLGQIGLIVICLFAFQIGWWAPGVVVCLYFITGFVPSQIIALQAQLRLQKESGPSKTCSWCGTARSIDYFSLDKSSSDGHGDLCVMCVHPEMRVALQKFKANPADHGED
jgi:hypothetical protein